MKTKKAGRKVDLSDINIEEIEKWMKNNRQSFDIIKCQAIISLNKGAQMQEVCNVLGVTREAVRLWKKKLRKGGINELLKKGKVGKRSRLTAMKQIELKRVIKQPPENSELEGQKWTGKLVKSYVLKSWNMDINIRTAHQWLNKAKE